MKRPCWTHLSFPLLSFPLPDTCSNYLPSALSTVWNIPFFQPLTCEFALSTLTFSKIWLDFIFSPASVWAPPLVCLEHLAPAHCPLSTPPPFTALPHLLSWLAPKPQLAPKLALVSLRISPTVACVPTGACRRRPPLCSAAQSPRWNSHWTLFLDLRVDSNLNDLQNWDELVDTKTLFLHWSLLLSLIVFSHLDRQSLGVGDRTKG